MRDVDDWVRDLRGPPTTARAPAWPSRRRWVWPGVLAVAATLALAVGLAPAVRPGTRGSIGEAAIELRLVVERGGVAVRLPSDGSLHVGERVYFRVSASRATPARVWVEGPTGRREEIGTIDADPRPRDLADGSGLIAYEFDGVGRYLFRTSTDGSCRGCPAVTVDVR